MKHITGQWPALAAKPKDPPAFANPQELHWPQNGSYGPNICESCWGTGWRKDRDGALLRCNACDRVKNNQIASCWSISGLKPTQADPPTLQSVLEGQEAMHEAVRRFAKQPTGWLTIHGSAGAGKSYAALALARWLLGRAKVPALFQQAPDLFVWLGATWRSDGDDTDYESRLRFLQDVPVLIVDEWNKEGDSVTVRKLRTRLFQKRFDYADRGEGGATVLITNDPPAAWHDKALTSRASDTRFAVIAAPAIDYRRVQR